MKYYNKELPTEIHIIYGSRHYGKTYREFEILKTRIKELEEENKRLELENEKHKSWVNSLNKDNHKFRDRIDKTIEYIEENKQLFIFDNLRKDGTLQYTIECDADDLLKILKGERVNDKN